VHYLTSKEGGRKIAVSSGYRGQFYYDGKDWDAPQEFIDKEICYPGEDVRVFLRTCRPEAHIGKFYVGKQFEIREGLRTVAVGTITKVIRSDFLQCTGDEST